MPTYLVTGGCGFIGRHVVERLLREHAQFVRIVDDLSYGKRENVTALAEVEEVVGAPAGRPDRPIQLVIADVRDQAIAEAACRNVDVVIHLAANTGVAPSIADPRSDCAINIIGTLNYLEGARKAGVSRFVFASSGATVGEVEPPIHELLPTRPVSPYGASKLAGEAYCSAYARSFGIDTVALRFGNVYGPRSEHKESVVAKFIRHALAGEALPVFGSGTQTRDFVYIDDLVRAILLACATPKIGGEIFQIATARETTINELAAALSSALVCEGVPRPSLDFQDRRVGDVARNFSDTRKAWERLGWQAEVTLADGLRRMVRSALAAAKAEGATAPSPQAEGRNRLPEQSRLDRGEAALL